MGLPPERSRILSAMGQGAALKAHRTLDGAKIHQLHPLNGATITVATAAVRALEKRGWLRSNMKFPVATYLLTEKGRQAALRLVE